jgi:magnesium transporter
MQAKILELINQKKMVEARDELLKLNVVDIALFFVELDRDNLVSCFRILPKDIAAEVFSYIDSDVQRLIVDAILDNEIRTIINNSFLDDTVDFLEEMPANVVRRVLSNTDENTRKLINEFLSYPEDSAGSIMTIEYVSLKEGMTVQQALKYIKENGTDKETINNCYVLDEFRTLKGVVTIRKLILSDEDDFIKNIMSDKFISVNTFDDQEEIAFRFKKYDLLSMPVVDKEQKLVGIVTIDDIIDVIDIEVTEDIQKMAAMAPSEVPYLKTKTIKLVRNRIWWLLFLMISATFSGMIINKYDEILSSYIILAAFIPVIMDTGGNSGSQSSTLIIRSMALGEIKTSDFFRVVWKEARVSLLAGGILSVVNFLRVYFIEKTSLAIAAVVSLTLMVTVMLSKIIGGALPIIAKIFKVDPAIMAGPLITTIVDVMALSIYFGLASLFLGIT